MGNAHSEEEADTGTAGPGNTNLGGSGSDSDSEEEVIHQEIMSSPSAVAAPRVTEAAGDGCVILTPESFRNFGSETLFPKLFCRKKFPKLFFAEYLHQKSFRNFYANDVKNMMAGTKI